MKPLRGKRVDPQSRPGEFSSSAGSCGVTRWGPFAVHACRAAVSSVRRVHFFRAERHDRFPRRSEEPGEGIPPRPRCRRSGVIAPESRAVGRPRTGRPDVALALACTSRPADTALWAVAANRECAVGGVRVGARWSVANRSGVHPTRLETRTKESNMCASHWVLRNLKAQ